MRVALAIASSSGGGGGGDGGAGVGGRDELTVRCRMGNGSGAVLARRVDGAQLECASAARGLGAARVSLSANSRAAALPNINARGRPSAEQLVAWRAVRRVDDAMACGREHSILGAGCCVGPARANRCGAVAPVAGECVDVSLKENVRCERAKMAFFWLSGSRRDRRSRETLLWGEAREKTRRAFFHDVLSLVPTFPDFTRKWYTFSLFQSVVDCARVGCVRPSP